MPSEPIDLFHLGSPRTIGAYVVETDDGPALFDCGPTSTVERLEAGLAERGLALTDLRHLLLSHIHLDHAGAAGVLVRRHPDLVVHVAEVGAPHLVDPARLEASARRLYGDAFDGLWGELVPVPAANVRIAEGDVAGLEAFPTPGHAQHHVSYLHADGTLYAGDAAGVRIEPARFVLPPCPPPEIDLEAWERSLDEIERRAPARLAVIHFGGFDDVQSHLARLRETLGRWGAWVKNGMDEPTFVAAARADVAASDPGLDEVYDRAAPLWHTYLGLERYYRRGEKLRLPEAPQAVAPLRHRRFRLLFSGRVVSFAGSAMAPIALAFAVLGLGGSATDLGLVLTLALIPRLLLILVGGVVADRLPRSAVMVGSNLVSGAAQLPAQDLQSANALLRLALNTTTIAGAAVGGAVVAAAGAGWAIAFDGVTFLVSAAILTQLHVTAPARDAASSFGRELADGWREFRTRTWLWVVVAGFGFSNAASASAFGVLGPVVASESLGGAGVWGLVLAAQGVGLLIGSLIALRIRPHRPLAVGVGVMVLTAPPLALLAVQAPVGLLALSALLSGCAIDIFSVLWDTSLQGHVPLDRLSRVSAWDALGSWVLMPLAFALVGPLADAIGVETTLWLAAAIVLAAMLAQLAVPAVRRLPRTEALPSPS